jgi:hypothetical protein
MADCTSESLPEDASRFFEDVAVNGTVPELFDYLIPPQKLC